MACRSGRPRGVAYLLAAVWAACVLAGSRAAQAEDPAAPQDWAAYGGGPAQLRFSSLRQVHRGNVARLQVAWIHDAGDAFGQGALGSEMQCNPVVIGRRLFAITPTLRVIALDAATGALQWSFDPNEGRPVTMKRRSRGVAHAGDGDSARIFFGAGHFLYSLDARTGRPDRSFGRAGRVDLRHGLGRDAIAQSVFLTSPPLVFEDLVIVGGAVSETLPSSPGYVRAYDRASGALRWTFRTIPAAGEEGADTWPPGAAERSGGANNWAGMSLDVARGLVFVPTGSPAFDFYGGDRRGDNLFANTLLALDARSGRRAWSYQTVRHDLWDRDLPAPPSLVTVRLGERAREAVAQVTKSGHVFLLDRDSGEPLFPVDEVAAPASDVAGESAAARQPVPRLPRPFARQWLDESTLTRRSPEAYEAVLREFRRLRYRGPFDPPSLEGTLIQPGLDGGASWGGAAFDPETGWLYVNANDVPWILKLAPRPAAGPRVSGASLYREHCSGCHGLERAGHPPQVPALTQLGERFSRQEITLAVLTGGARMPSFAHLGLPATEAIAEYLLSGRDVELGGDAAMTDHRHSNRVSGLPFSLDGYRRFLDPDGYPAIAPPWGTLTAIDLSTGEHAWRVPLGFYPELAGRGLADTGSENYGGPVVTAGGLLFIGATVYDNRFRAFDKTNGQLLWEWELPAAGHATPAVYEVDGRQYIVIAAGGGKNPKGRSAASLIAFALPPEDGR